MFGSRGSWHELHSMEVVHGRERKVGACEAIFFGDFKGNLRLPLKFLFLLDKRHAQVEGKCGRFDCIFMKMDNESYPLDQSYCEDDFSFLLSVHVLKLMRFVDW